MIDIFDLFGPPKAETARIRASLWLFNTTGGILILEGLSGSQAQAEQKLREFTGLDLIFTPERLDPDSFSKKSYKANVNVAVIYEVGGEVLCHSRIPEGWNPPTRR